MFVTNLTARPQGIDGIIILGANEENRYIEDTPDLTDRVNSLKHHNIVSVLLEEGLTKPEPIEEVVPVVTEIEEVEEATEGKVNASARSRKLTKDSK